MLPPFVPGYVHVFIALREVGSVDAVVHAGQQGRVRHRIELHGQDGVQVELYLNVPGAQMGRVNFTDRIGVDAEEQVGQE